MFPPYSVKARN